MRRLDPHLVAEDNNALFEAFCRLREGRRGWLDVRWPRVEDLSQLVASSLVVVITVGLFFIIGCCALLIPPLLWLLFSLARSSKRRAGGAFPRTVGGVFAPSGFHEEAAVDLWLAGARGREILEAIYLESRRSSPLVCLLITLLATLPVAGLLILAFLFMGMPPAAMGLFRLVYLAPGIILFIWLLCELFLLVWTLDKGDKMRRAVENRLVIWRGEPLAMMTIMHLFIDISLFLIILVPLALFEWMLWLSAWSVFLEGFGWSREAWFAHGVPLTALINIIGLVGFLWLLRRILMSVFDSTMNDNLKEADRTFERFMGRHVLKDPDGHLWGAMPPVPIQPRPSPRPPAR